MKYTVIDDDASTIRALLAAASALHAQIDNRNVTLGVIDDPGFSPGRQVAVVMAARDAGAADKGYTVATIEAKPMLIRVEPDDPKPEHDPNAAGHFIRLSEGKLSCTCFEPCCNTDDGELCTCPGCESDVHEHGAR